MNNSSCVNPCIAIHMDILLIKRGNKIHTFQNTCVLVRQNDRKKIINMKISSLIFFLNYCMCKSLSLRNQPFLKYSMHK